MSGDIGFDGGLTCSMQCSNLDKAIAWYEDVLGFELLYKLDEMAWCEMKSPVARVNVGLSQVEAPEVKGGATLTFGVKDIGRARKALEKKDVRFDGETMTIPGMVSLATFFDADGNKLMLFQDLSQ
ncbi:MAG: VOC family protein, partial [Planctomycetota bacterium]|nr:VOC family protein [Planctomycetota bacterium]